jgi:hypothetical protein
VDKLWHELIVIYEIFAAMWKVKAEELRNRKIFMTNLMKLV